MKRGTDVKKKYRKLPKKKLGVQDDAEINCSYRMKKSKKDWSNNEINSLHGQLLVDCLDLKISKKLSEVRKN